MLKEPDIHTPKPLGQVKKNFGVVISWPDKVMTEEDDERRARLSVELVLDPGRPGKLKKLTN